jgi:hypothetical protein
MSISAGGTLAVGQFQSSVDVVRKAQTLDGEIDEVRLWKVARTQAELMEYMDKTIGDDEANLEHLTGYWRFDNGPAYNGDVAVGRKLDGSATELTNVASAEVCFYKCDADSKCNAFQYNTDNEQCHLQHGKPTFTDSDAKYAAGIGSY